MDDTTDPTADHHDSATDPTDDGLSVNDAADRLGISPDAVRARIRRGTLAAEKQGNLWTVYLSETTRHDAEHNAGRTVSRHDTTDPTAAHGTDIAPLTTLIDDLTRRNADLAAAAAMWQTRAHFFEEQLRQVEAGARGETPESAPHEPQVETYRATPEASSPGVLARLRWWLARVR